MKNATILGSLRNDVALFYGFAFALMVSFFFARLWEYSIITMGVLVLLDMGHAYATLLRTYFRKPELSRTTFYMWGPVLIFFIMFSWSYAGVPFFWRFLLYMTFFHHMRQNLGLFLWYAKIESYKPTTFERFNIYLTALIPFVLFHFRDIDYRPLYHFSEYASTTETPIIRYLIGAYTIYFLISMAMMFRKMSTQKLGHGLALSYIFPACLNYICFLVFKHSLQVYMPLLAFHAVSYLALMSHSVDKLSDKKISPFKIWGSLMGIVVFFVTIEYLVTDHFEIFESPASLQGNMTLSIIASLSVLPNLMHFIIDGLIWKRDNPDFKLILSQGTK